MMKQNRREFLKVAGLAAVGAGLAIGCGGHRREAETVPEGTEAPPAEPVEEKKPSGPSRMELRFYPYELQLQHTFTVSSYSRNTTPGVQVEIAYQGYTGYGEASMPPYLGQSVESVTEFLRKVELRQFADPFCLDDILTYVDGLSPADSAAKAAVDIALHDLVGKMLDAPWYRIWGYNPSRTPSTTFTIGIDTPEVVREKTLECADKFNILKIKVGTEHDKEMVEAIRSVTDLPLAVDANQGWTDRFHALDMIYWLKEHGIVMVEQPLPVGNVEDQAWLNERSPLPLFADESVQRLADVPRMQGLFSGINIKLMKCTGLREAHKMVDLSRGLGMKVMLGCMTETSCGISAAAQLSPAVDFADLDGNLLISNDIFTGVTVKDGRLVLPDRPGIGVERLAN